MCPCGSGRLHEDCCGRFLSGKAYPETAEELMRSRYSAYAAGRMDWVRLTWAPETVPADLSGGESVKWLGLKVVAAQDVDESHAVVEFIARGRAGSGGAFRMHERSRFEKRSGKWLYVDGDQL
jgi:SEC-C motif-containing protein